MKKKIIITLFTLSILAACGGLVLFSLYEGYLRLNYPSLTEFPIQGLDISNHQKVIDWEQVDKEKVRFVYIKSTEGGDFKDKSFERNWQQAKEQKITVGAYHFFTFCRSPEEQAQNYIQTVPMDDDMLPPAIDLEYGGNCKLTKTKEELLCDITTFMHLIENHYQRRMVIYVTEDFYADILKGEFLNNHFWVRDVYTRPQTSDNRLWTFWQHSNRGRMKGIATPVDLNVFRGSENEFKNLLKDRF